MTNKDKFLRDGVSAEEFIQKLTNHINKTQKSTYEKIKEFLEQPAQILTEDEREDLISTAKLKPNNGKKDDEAHPAIHPTGILPSGLSKDEQKIYDLIATNIEGITKKNS